MRLLRIIAVIFLGVLGLWAALILAGDIGYTGFSFRVLAPATVILVSVSGPIGLWRGWQPRVLLFSVPLTAVSATALMLWIYWPEVDFARALRAMANGHYAATAAAIRDDELDRLPAARLALYLRLRGLARLLHASQIVHDDAEMKAALDDYLQAARFRPHDAKIEAELAAVLDALGAHAEALQMYDRALRDGGDYRIMLDRSDAHLHAGELEAALADADEAARILGDKGPNMPVSYHRGRALYALKRYEEADTEFLQGLRAQADYPWPYLYMGCASAHSGNYERAVENYNKGIEVYRQLVRANSEREHSPIEARHREVMTSQLAVIQRLAKGGTASAEETASLCTDFNDDNTPRQRSMLLPVTIDLPGAD
ncbi:MAG: tetratricopeptide repeat protein [Rhodospirillaceae bacterium]